MMCDAVPDAMLWCREERAASNEEKLRMFVYTMEVASKRADASGMLH